MADFIRADLHGSRFERVDLSGAELFAVDLADARFRGVDLSGVVMRGVELVNVDIHGEIENVTINGVDIGSGSGPRGLSGQRRTVAGGGDRPEPGRSHPGGAWVAVDGAGLGAAQRKLFGQIIVRHMCATGEPSKPSPSAGCRKFRPTTSSNSSKSTTTSGSKE
jgi:Pentapeptide repeats (8 copies)